MCPEFERVERIVQQMVDGCEKVQRLETYEAKFAQLNAFCRKQPNREPEYRAKTSWSSGSDDLLLAMMNSFPQIFDHQSCLSKAWIT